MRALRAARAHSPGFTLVEILVAVSILAILSATLSPMVVKHIHGSRLARARSDAATLVTAIEAFQLDTGHWPVSSDGNPGGSEELSRLVGLPAAQIAPAAIPDGAGSAAGDGNWRGGGDGGNAAALEDLLIFNQSDSVDPLYPPAANGSGPGWRGPYLDRVPLDPWGNPYVCNLRYLRGASVSGVTDAEAANHAVFCLSAGANLVFETSFEDATALASTPGGDDVGALLESSSVRTSSGGGSGGDDGGACGLLGPEALLLWGLVRALRRRAARRRVRSCS